MIFRLLVLLTSIPVFFFFLFKQKTAYEMRISDWSSDVCSSDLDRDHASCLFPLLLTELLAVRGDDARDRGFADAVQPCHLGTGLATGGDGFGDFATLL